VFYCKSFVKAEDKKAVLGQIIESTLPPQLYNAAGRSAAYSIAEAICQKYLALLRQLNQTVLAEVISTNRTDRSSTAVSPRKGQNMTNAHELDARLIET